MKALALCALLGLALAIASLRYRSHLRDPATPSWVDIVLFFFAPVAGVLFVLLLDLALLLALPVYLVHRGVAQVGRELRRRFTRPSMGGETGVAREAESLR